MIDQEHGQEREDDQRAPPPRKPVIVRALRALKRQYHRYAAEAQERDADHKINERIMARWTRYVGIFTIVLTIVAVVSAVISYQALMVIQGQLSEMRSASEESKRLIDAAQKTAEAARDTVEVSKQTAEKELRAYVSVENFLVVGIKGKVILFIRFRNAGQTPAHELSIEGSLVLGSSNQALYKIPTGLGPSRITLGRSMLTSGTYEIDVSKHKDFIANPETNILFFGKVTYRDVFDNLRTTRYMFKRAPRTGNLWAMSATPEGNEAD